MNLLNHPPSAKVTDAVTYSATTLAPLLVQIVQPRNRLRSFDFVKSLSPKKESALATFLMGSVSLIFHANSYEAAWVMKTSMIRLRNKLKILNGIIQGVAVDMVDNLNRKRLQGASEVLFHNKSVFRDSLAIYLKHSVPALNRTFAVQRSSIVGVTMSPLPLVVNTAKTAREVFIAALRFGANPHPPTISPFNMLCKYIPISIWY